MNRPRLGFWQIWNMSFGFLGIQFGWALQLGNMSAIYEKLGAAAEEIPLLWLAAPLTGLIVQPVIGSMSDRTWNRLGRRRPYFLVGAILASCALFIMPTSSTLWMAAGLLWVLDASINISMEPFRAFVADKLNPGQRNVGFVMQSFFIGLGATMAGFLPFMFSWLGVREQTTSGIPLTVKYAFQCGAVAFLLAVLWTVFGSSEYPPDDPEEFARLRKERRGIRVVAGEIVTALHEMPSTMKQLAVVQVFTWLGLFCMWLFYVPAVARRVFNATDPRSHSYTQGVEWGNLTFSVYSITCFAIAFALPWLAAKTSRKAVHAAALVCGSLGLFSVYVVSNRYLLIFSMIGVGIAWASILSMPYAILSTALPAGRIGVYMGIFNLFIVIPEIVQALTFGPLIRILFGSGNANSPVFMVMIGGACLLIAASLVPLVHDVASRRIPVLEPGEPETLTIPDSVHPVPTTGGADQ
jgi:maltose/moltooligosaccharide transporter